MLVPLTISGWRFNTRLKKLLKKNGQKPQPPQPPQQQREKTKISPAHHCLDHVDALFQQTFDKITTKPPKQQPPQQQQQQREKTKISPADHSLDHVDALFAQTFDGGEDGDLAGGLCLATQHIQCDERPSAADAGAERTEKNCVPSVLTTANDLSTILQ